MHRTLGFVFGIVCIAAVAGCAANSASKGVEEGTLVPMNTEEILAAVTGNSEVWPGSGAGYYQEDGTFLGIWKGDEAQGPWWVENDVRCYDVEEWAASGAMSSIAEATKLF